MILAEGATDVIIGTAPELTEAQAEQTAERYYSALADEHGLEPLRGLAEVYDYIDRQARSGGTIREGEQFNVAANAPGRRALARVLERRGGEGTPGGGSQLPEGSDRGPSSGGPPSGGPDDSLRAGALEGRHAPAQRTAPGSLHSTANPGLSDEELESWSKARSFRVEPAGEQLGMLGDSDKIFRVLGDRSRHVALVHTRTISPKQNLSSSTLPTDKQHHWLRPSHDSPRHSFRSGQSRETAYACHSCHTEGQPCEGRMTYSWPKKKPLGAPEPTVHAGLRR